MSSSFWDNIYKTKNESDMSWFQQVPEKYLQLIQELKIGFDEKIIDIGGGDSMFVDHLLDFGFRDISVLDISQDALEKTKLRIKSRSDVVKFILSDVTQFTPNVRYKLWHDRATFHFLTEKTQIEKYLKIANEAVDEDGALIISTFSKNGPDKCSGLPVSQYSEIDLKQLFGEFFHNIKCFEVAHATPWNTKQSFVYCGFKKLKNQLI